MSEQTKPETRIEQIKRVSSEDRSYTWSGLDVLTVIEGKDAEIAELEAENKAMRESGAIVNAALENALHYRVNPKVAEMKITIDRLEAQAAHSTDIIESLRASEEHLQKQLAKSEAEAAAMKRAILPFQASEITVGRSDEERVFPVVTVGDLRRARLALYSNSGQELLAELEAARKVVEAASYHLNNYVSSREKLKEAVEAYDRAKERK